MCKRKGHERSLRIFKSKQVVKNSTEPEVEEIKGIHEQQYLSDREVGHRLKAVPDVQGVTEDTRFKATTELYRYVFCLRIYVDYMQTDLNFALLFCENRKTVKLRHNLWRILLILSYQGSLLST